MATPDISTKPEPSTKCRRKQRASPFVGLFLISAFVLSSSMVPYFALRRRFMRSEENLKNFLSVARREQLLALSQNHAQLNKSLETMRMQLDKAMGDLKDVRTAMLKDRNTANALEKHADGMRMQLKVHEEKILSVLAAGTNRTSKTDSAINELRITASNNTKKLSRVGDSLAEIAAFIDRTEIEQGVLPEPGKESSLRVDRLRSKALDLVKDN